MAGAESMALALGIWAPGEDKGPALTQNMLRPSKLRMFLGKMVSLSPGGKKSG